MSLPQNDGFREKLSFSSCPVCGGPLRVGRLGLPSSLSSFKHMSTLFWMSQENVRKVEAEPLKYIFFAPFDAETFVKNSEIAPIPAGLCEKCGKIFPELDIKTRNDPIGEKT